MIRNKIDKMMIDYPKKTLPSFQGKYPKLYNHILNNYLGDSFSQKLYNYIHKIKSPNKCKMCNNQTKFKNYKFGYQPYCCKKCSAIDRCSKDGYLNPAKSKSAKVKISNSRKNYTKYTKILQKEIQETLDINFLFGNSDYESSKIKHMINDIIKKYPCHYGRMIKKRRNDIYQYIIKNIPGDSFKEKLYCYISNINTIPTCENINCQKKSPFKNIHEGYQRYCSIQCSSNETIKIATTAQNEMIKNGTLKINYKNSKLEKEVVDFITSIYSGVVIENDRIILNPYELDIYLPDENLAIEFDGVFWHSYNQKETIKEKNRHLYKTKCCENKNIHLIHIFDTEWLNNKEIVKSRIKSLLNKTQKIFARKCTVKKISSKLSKAFFDKTHLQGYVAGETYALYFEGEIVCAMSFRKPRYAKNIQYELLRFSTKLNYTVIGGASKLLKTFIRDKSPKSIISYADRRYSKNGGLYKKLGFKLDGISKPNYYYLKDYILYTRIKFQKHKQKNILKLYDINNTEGQNMFNNGYRRIWDCGNFRFILNL